MAVVKPLTEQECLAVLAELGVGRLAYLDAGHARAVPMFFAVRDGNVVLYAKPGRLLSALQAHPNGLTLEVDDVDTATAWRSVLAVGAFAPSEDTGDREALRHAIEQARSPYRATALQDLAGPEVVVGRLTMGPISGRRMLP